jgi:hypothetical protein
LQSREHQIKIFQQVNLEKIKKSIEIKGHDVRGAHEMKITKIRLKNLFYIFIAIVYFIENNPTIKVNTLIRYTFIIVTVGFALCKALWNRSSKLNGFHIWMALVLVFFMVSSRWSLESVKTIQNIKNAFIIYAICFAIIIMIENEEDFLMLIKSMVLSFAVESLYVLSIVGMDNLGTMRLGVDYEGLELWNANAIASFTAWGGILAVFLIVYSNKKTEKIRWGIVAIFLIVMTFYTGSRKGVIIVVGTLLIYNLYANRGNKRVRNICFVVLALIVLYIFIMNNEEIYILVGARLERMVQELTGHRTTEQSMSMRMLMITYGMRWFTERPILGYGLGNYSVLFSRTFGLDTYSHCNYVEILVSGGVVGFIIYYSIYVRIFTKYIKEMLRRHNKIIIYFFSILLINTILNMALVCYSDITYITILLIVYLICDKKLYL